MQPTYIPWAGYFNLMSQVDLFVYLDDAQYEKSSWQNRNRMLVHGAPIWLTIPVIRGFLGASINQVVVDKMQPWQRKHIALLTNSYARHAYIQDALEVREILLDDSLTQLADLNIAILEAFRKKLGVNTKTIRSSSLGIDGTRTDRLIRILTELGATEYIAPAGSLVYLTEDKFVERSHTRLTVHDFEPSSYSQRGTHEFISHLSILDVVANLGWEGAGRYIMLSTQLEL